MRIRGQQGEAALRHRERRERALAVPLGGHRPCDGCEVPCGCAARSTTCACGCHAGCPGAARQLSSDPDRHPIEPGVLALVLELGSTGVFTPCWSCEGHLAGDTWRRLPQVWLYASEPAYVELLVAHIAALAAQRRLENRWSVRVGEYSECDATTYILAPDVLGAGAGTLAPTDSVLASLQRDLATLAGGLVAALRREAERG